MIGRQLLGSRRHFSVVLASRSSSPPRAPLHLLGARAGRRTAGGEAAPRPLGVLLCHKLALFMKPLASPSCRVFNSASYLRSGSMARRWLTKLLLSACFPFRRRRQRAG